MGPIPSLYFTYLYQAESVVLAVGGGSANGSEESALPRDVDANVGGLDFIEHPALVFRVVRVLLAKIIPDDLPRTLLIGIAEFPGELDRFIGSHSFECRP